MRIFTKHIILWVVALSILNTSIDIVNIGMPSFGYEDQADTEGYTEIESIVEFFIDESSGHEQQLPDSNGNDQQQLLKKMASFDFTIHLRKEKPGFSTLMVTRPDHRYDYSNNLLPAGYISRLMRPPDAA